MRDFVLFSLSKQSFLIPLEYVVEFSVLGDITYVPHASKQYLGTVIVRQRTVPLVDLRTILGFKGARTEADELIQTLNAREEDHRRWLAELEASVNEKREFKLTTDPTQCAFGKWYAKFTTTNRGLARVMERLDLPHRRIHAVGVTARKMVDEGRADEALRLIEQTRETDLKGLIEQFDRARKLIAELGRERIGILINLRGREMVIPVDLVDRTMSLGEDRIQGEFGLIEEGKAAVILRPETFVHLDETETQPRLSAVP